MAYHETESLKRIVKQRAAQLRDEGCGYLQAVNTIVDELYRTKRGEDTPIGRIGVTAGMVSVSLLGLLFNVIKFVVKELQGATAKKMQEKEALRAQVSPWISAVYESAHGAAGGR